MLSPARGGSGSSWSSTSMSPACSAAATLMVLFMACLRCLRESKVRAGRPLQLGKALLVHRQVSGEIQLMHAQLSRAIEHHGEVHAPRRIARLGALDRLPGDGNQL